MVVPATVDASRPVAVVTGAGSPTGIGLACAQALAPTLALLIAATSSRIEDRVAELIAAGAQAVGFVGDLSDSSTAQRLVRDALEHLGRVDVLVNNAGMTATTGSEEQAPAELTSDDQWRGALSRNLDTNFFVTRAVLTPMAQQAFGRIVNVGSVSGSVMAYRGDAAYHAAKQPWLG
jgi:3-oxoacyl-[acyl-carrier protein] reductase